MLSINFFIFQLINSIGNQIQRCDMYRFAFLLLPVFLMACSHHKGQNLDNKISQGTAATNAANVKDSADTSRGFSSFHQFKVAISNKKVADTTYLPTGFYFPVAAGKGVNKRLENSDKIYTISRSPFASVKNIRNAELKKSHINNSEYTACV